MIYNLFKIFKKILIIYMCIVSIFIINPIILLKNENTFNQSYITEKVNYKKNISKITSRGSFDRRKQIKSYNIYIICINQIEIIFKDEKEANEKKSYIINKTEFINFNIDIKETKDLNNIDNEEIINEKVNKIIYSLNKDKIYFPTISHTISSPFGKRISPTKGASSYHKGIDISGKYGDNIYAYKSGKIIEASYSSNGYGNTILIDHGNGIETRYGHLSKINVKVGDIIEGGTIIGKMGSTGISTGNHLHFEVIENGIQINPYNFIF